MPSPEVSLGKKRVSRTTKLAAPVALTILLLWSCSNGSDDEGGLSSGGTQPPPGFLDRTDANCRAAATENDEVGPLTDTAPTIRQLNGQSLFGYTSADGRSVQCVVRHMDENVIDLRMIGSE